MAQSSRSFHRLAACILVLSCFGGVWWLLLPEGTEDPVAAVVQMARNLTGDKDKDSDSGSPASSSDASASSADDSASSGASAASTGGASEASDASASSGAALPEAASQNTAAAGESGESQASAQSVTSGRERGSDAESAGQASGRIAPSKGPHEVSAALGSGPAQAVADPQEELLARVEKAMQQPGTTVPGGDSVSGTVENRPPLPDDGRQDSVVTADFARDMGSWMAASYVPPRRDGERGHTSLTLMNVNFRYSNSGTLRSVERDPLKSRSVILNYVFTPGMMEALYHMYAPALVEQMERAARDEGRRHPLDDAHVADMFRVYADRFHRLGTSLDAASAADLLSLSAAIHREAAHEATANDDFARAYTALAQARDRGSSEDVAVQSRRMSESTRIAGMYAERQEQARNNMIHAIRSHASDRTLSSAELLFLGEWLSRRQASEASVHAAADICRRTADLMLRRADRILDPAGGVGRAQGEPSASTESAGEAGIVSETSSARSAASQTRRYSFADRAPSGIEASGRLIRDEASGASPVSASGESAAAPAASSVSAEPSVVSASSPQPSAPSSASSAAPAGDAAPAVPAQPEADAQSAMPASPAPASAVPAAPSSSVAPAGDAAPAAPAQPEADAQSAMPVSPAPASAVPAAPSSSPASASGESAAASAASSVSAELSAVSAASPQPSAAPAGDAVPAAPAQPEADAQSVTPASPAPASAAPAAPFSSVAPASGESAAAPAASAVSAEPSAVPAAL